MILSLGVKLPLALLEGAPVWTVYIGVMLAALAALPGQERWENRGR